jgi:hypothetical protein
MTSPRTALIDGEQPWVFYYIYLYCMLARFVMFTCDILRQDAALPVSKPRASTQAMLLKCVFFWRRLLRGCRRWLLWIIRMTTTCMSCAPLRMELERLAVSPPLFVSPDR